MRRILTALLFIMLAGCGYAQTQSGTGGLVGQVFCSDTQKPARFALVSLVPDVTEEGVNRRSYGSSSASTAADGTFSMKDVLPGVYDVQVLMPGYIQPIRQLNLFTDSDSDLRQRLLRMLTKVKIDAGQTANATVTAYRGADLSGTVNYDDGTPAAGITVSALMAIPVAGSDTSTSANTNLRAVGSNSQTDDRGRFHLSGLSDGSYTVQALPRGGGLFPVYLGNTIDRAKAALVTAKAGDERTGMDLQMDITDLHRVRGVLMSPDNHALANVNVTLTLADSPTGQLSATTGPDGSFSFATVPDGKFTVAATGAYDPETRIVYKGASSQITVSGSDISDIALTVSQ
jgi:hypothetical protein